MAGLIHELQGVFIRVPRRATQQTGAERSRERGSDLTGITAESHNKRQGGGEDEGMRWNRETGIQRALHEVRLPAGDRREAHRGSYNSD